LINAMLLRRDLASARRLLANVLRSWRNRRAVAKRAPRQPKPPAGSIKIGVYFADSTVNMYQIQQWYAPLAELASRWPVAIIARSPGTVLRLWDEAPVPSVYVRTVVDLEEFIGSQNLRMVFYVNQNARNFPMFRYGRMWHVFINHGESEKVYMTSNQFKAYDYSFVAGQAALDRLADNLWDFDLAKRAIAIGRPQADHMAGFAPYPAHDRTVVLYSPTWEGDAASARYGSILSHGRALTDALLASNRHKLIYRPHPRSGVLDPAYRAANERIIRAIARANGADPNSHHVYDDGIELGWQLAAADVAITDISAMIYDRLATGKPLIVTRPVSLEAEIDERGYLAACEWLDAEASADILASIDRVRLDTQALARLQFWAQHHFGDTRAGAATARFHAAVETLTAEWERHSAMHSTDDRASAGAAFEHDGDETDDEDALPEGY